MFKKVLIANRGEIACRVIRTLKKLGIASVAVYSDVDAHAAHVTQADEAVHIGPAPAAESYLRSDKILAAAKATGAQAIHPGYGFLSENADFADACDAAGIVFIGPTGDNMRRVGLKHAAREIAKATGVPLLPGSDLLSDIHAARTEAARIGYPVMLKATAGGGGIGMRLCETADELADAFAAVERLSRNNFKETGIYLEKFVRIARHVEVQMFGDGKGLVAPLGERDCSLQRRNQKVVEETPAPGITAELRAGLFAAAKKLGEAIKYRSAGTCEFIVDAATQQFYFLEVNTRLQVEHTVTEEVLGIDLVEWMVRQAANQNFGLANFTPNPKGASIQVRLYAEDANKNFQPSSGIITHVEFPKTARIETWVDNGTEISPFYDPLIAKIIVNGNTRDKAIDNLQAGLAATKVYGIESNLSYLRQIAATDIFRTGNVSTKALASFVYTPHTIDVLDGGPQSAVQDYPGRIGYWDIGVPPSGPMDHLAFRLANRILNNPESAPALELAISGPTLKFNAATTIALTGAHMEATLDGAPLPYWTAVEVKPGSTLKLKAIKGPGFRTYLAIKNGLDVAHYLNSASTFTLGKFGGHAGRILRAGDVLGIKEQEARSKKQEEATQSSVLSPQSFVPPTYSTHYPIAVLYGPHGAPDFFTQQDIDTLFSTDWKIHYNSNRTGVRLIGPKPQWARRDGGEAGLHPSNIHDNAYAIGTIDFTGDMPVILGPDGPSLGGFVCPATIIQSELWKIGQLKPGDTVRFIPVTVAQANALELAQDHAIATLTGNPSPDPTPHAINISASSTPVLQTLPETRTRPAVVYRQDGDKYLLVEYGPLVLDLNLRFRVHALVEHLRANKIEGIIDLTPGIRSLHIHFDSRVLPQQKLLATLTAIEEKLPAIEDIEVPTRVIHMPLSWDDPATQKAIDIYMKSVRPDAPWCPSNIEFIRRINGLNSIEDVKKIVFGASYLVLGLGDVYLGAPVATPADPRHRLVTTKYNPARTWTAENSVGIGGAYMCIYGMEGPGGYQFVGRTIQVWNTFKSTQDFEPGKPWLLRFFDQIRFYPVTADEILKLREQFLQGTFKLNITHETFSLKQYNAFLKENEASIKAFKHTQQSSFEAERDRWAAAGQLVVAEPEVEAPTDTIAQIPPDCEAIAATIAGNVWKISAKKGDTVKTGDRVVIIESMKMEINILSQSDGVIEEILCTEGKPVAAGQALVIIRTV